MAETRADMFLRAKRELRINPALTDAELCQAADIPRGIADQVIPPARQEMARDGIEPWMAGAQFSQTAEVVSDGIPAMPRRPGGGEPIPENLRAYVADHPFASPDEAAFATGLHRSKVRLWWLALHGGA